MNILANLPELNDPETASRLSDQAWVELHVPRFDAIRPGYVQYEDFLERVLKAFCRQVAPLAIVQARAKNVTSFAEKILRKRKSYVDAAEALAPDPLVRLTDLCGGRVITQTQDQLRAVCELVKATFDIDWSNSDDASTRLKTSEFGYRTINFIVMANPEKLQKAGFDIPVPPEILGSVRPESALPVRFKAEVQVRTLLEHAYADIAHDLTYKTDVKIPARIMRSFSVLAAVLEGADKEFARLVNSFSDFKSNYGAHHSPKQVADEIARLRVVLSCKPDRVDLAVRIAQLASVIGLYEKSIEVLTPYRNQEHQGVQRELGTALTTLFWDTPRAHEFNEGCSFLELACQHKERDAELLCTMAESWEHLGDDDKAGGFYRQAVAADAAEPRSLSRYLEFEIAHQRNDTVIKLAEPMIRNAMRRCARQIEGCVNLPVAWSSLVILHLLVGEPYDSLHAMAQLARMCESETTVRTGPPCTAGRALLRLRDSLVRRLRGVARSLAGYEWIDRMLTLMLAVRVGDESAKGELRKLASWSREHGDPVFTSGEKIVLLAGGCDASVQQLVETRFRQPFLDATDNLYFTLVAGGTHNGIGGVAGDAAERSAGRVRCIGYLPRNLPRGIREDDNPHRYARNISSPGTDFSPLDALQAWTDLVAAGVDPRRVKLLCYAGDAIARVESVLALVLGARAGLVEDPEIPKERQLTDASWLAHPGLVRMPIDRMTLRAYLLVDELPLDEREQKRLEKAARRSHEEYVKSVSPKEPNLQPWDRLDPSLRLSNFHQVAYWEQMLSEKGLGVRALTEEDRRHDPLAMELAIGEDGIALLAEMEHGRWNVERLERGWRYAQEKDVSLKLSPYLIPWSQLTEEIKDYDVNAIRNLPKAMREVGLEVYRL